MPQVARSLLHATVAYLAAAVAVVGAASAQHPAPGAETAKAGRPPWLERGAALLEAEDPVSAWRVFRAVADEGPERVDRALGLGRAHLMLGHSEFAIAYGEAATRAAPARQDAMALTVRGLIRARDFDGAVERSQAFLRRAGVVSAELWAARGSALFRVQRTRDAAAAYRRVVLMDRLHAEGHLRLGSGLLDPQRVEVTAGMVRAVDALDSGDRARAITLLSAELAQRPGHPIAHRLLGETLFAERTAESMAAQDEAFARLRAAMPRPDVRGLPIAAFVPGFAQLSPSRRAVVERTAALWGKRLDKLVTVGSRHDLLDELERTTDARARQSLRGQRTFDGRVWDDVRGIGGMCAATGIEALDEAATFGFDTFAHEVAHQVHFFAFTPLQRARIRSLYKQAMAERRCLDYYAASNEAEYFGQGVEAFVSLAKRPASETTHGHTRFELKRVDPDLHDFIADLVSFDPLADPTARGPLLEAAVAVAIRCGRPDDAVVAAEWLPPGPARTRLLARARRAEAELRCH